jgi:hypothetical protein
MNIEMFVKPEFRGTRRPLFTQQWPIASLKISAGTATDSVELKSYS